MSRLDRYLARHWLQGVALVMLGLLAVDGMMALTDELERVRAGIYDWPQAWVHLGLTLPRRLFEMLPIATFAGTLVGMSGLAARSELVVMQMAGWSRLRLAGGLMWGAVGMALVLLLVSEWVMPRAEEAARNLRHGSFDLQQSTRRGDVLWFTDQRYFVRLLRVRTGGQTRFLDVFVVEVDESGRPFRRLRADEMQPEHGQWRLRDVEEIRFLPRRVEYRRVQALTLPAVGEQRLLQAGLLNPRYLAMADLMRVRAFLRQRGMDERVYQVAFWQHVLRPLSLLVLVLAASHFVHGSSRSRSAGRNLLLGLMLGLLFYIVDRTMGNLARIYAVHVPLVLALPTLLTAAWAVWRFRTPRATGE